MRLWRVFSGWQADYGIHRLVFSDTAHEAIAKAAEAGLSRHDARNGAPAMPHPSAEEVIMVDGVETEDQGR